MTIARKLSFGLGTAFMVLLAVGTTASVRAAKLRNTAFWIQHTHEVQTKLALTLQLLLDEEASVRGFALTGQEDLLTPYDAAKAQLPTVLHEFRSLTSDNPAEQARLDRLDHLVDERQALLNEVLEMRQVAGLKAAAALVAHGRARAVLLSIREVIAEMNTEEARLLTTRTAAGRAAAHLAANASEILIATLVVMMAVSSWMFMAFVLRPVDRLVTGMERVATGDLHTRVQGHDHDEFNRLANAFNAMVDRRRDAEEALRRAMQLRNDVLGIVAHDLRNPVASITLAAEQVRRHLSKEVPTSVRTNLDRIVGASHRAERLIQDLLDVTRLEAGHLALKRERISASRVVFEAVEAQQLLASNARLSLRPDTEESLPEVMADHHRILQVLENLIGNALKFTPPGGEVTIGAKTENGEVLFHVSDSGPGIPAADVPHVFDRFWRGNRAERRSAGLGLAICKGIIEAHAGRIWVESPPGRGATFYFSIPVVTGSALHLVRESEDGLMAH